MASLDQRRSREGRSAVMARDARKLHLYEQGVSVEELARRFGAERLAVWQALDRATMHREIAIYRGARGAHVHDVDLTSAEDSLTL